MTTSPWLRKPVWVVLRQEQRHDGETMERHLTLFDLVSVGVGGTIGSGIFVLAGYVAHNYAGPATTLSFAISGLAACCSGICYAELAGRLPASGSTYTYAYVAMGELPAVIAAACLTLEYAVSGAAVARSWGSKVVIWLTNQINWAKAEEFLLPEGGFNPMAFFIAAVSTAILAKGIRESKFTTNFFTVTKVLLVIGVTVGGFSFFNPENLTPFAPKGAAGVVHGATSCFFAYLGYDEICVISGEALHPKRDMPRAVLLTLLIVTLLYILAVFSLTGMEQCENINDTSAFSAAFQQHNATWLAQITAFGVIFTLPVVVLVSLLAQPRLFQAMALDGLLPPVFARLDESGNLRMGALISGVGMTLLAAFVPFHYLDDLISAGILLAFSMTNSCLVLLRCEPPPSKPHLLRNCLVLFNGLSLATGMALSRKMPLAVLILFLVATVSTFSCMWWKCPRTSSFGGAVLRMDDSDSDSYFATPLVPLIPCVGMFVNWCLVAQLDWLSLLMLVGYVGIAVAFYYGVSRRQAPTTFSSWRREHEFEGIWNTGSGDPAASMIQLTNKNATAETSQGSNHLGIAQ